MTEQSSVPFSSYELQKLTHYVEEIIQVKSEVRSRGILPELSTSISGILEWVERTFPYTNTNGQEFAITVRVPNLPENSEFFRQFCEGIYFKGRCSPGNESSAPPQSLSTDAAKPLVGQGTGTTVLPIEIDFQVVNTKGLTAPYTVSFSFDPLIPFTEGRVSITHVLPKEPPGAKRIKIKVMSRAADFDASMIPPFPAMGEDIPKKHIWETSPAEFFDESPSHTFYELTLDMQPGDWYAFEGDYDV